MFWGSRLLLFEAKTNVPTLLHKCLQFAANNKNVQHVKGSYSYSCWRKKCKEAGLTAEGEKTKNRMHKVTEKS